MRSEGRVRAEAHGHALISASLAPVLGSAHYRSAARVQDETECPTLLLELNLPLLRFRRARSPLRLMVSPI